MRPLTVLFLIALLAGCISPAQTSREAASQKACAGAEGCYAAGMKSQDSDRCLLGLAVSCQDALICGRIVDKEYEYRCGLQFNEYDTVLCGGIANESVKVECYNNGAVLKSDPAVCDKIPEQAAKDMCRAAVAYKSGKRMICNDIRQQDRREFCFAAADRDGTICGELTSEELRIKCVEWTMKKLPKT